MGNRGEPRVCFVAHNAYGALAGGDAGHIGGVERQTSLMAQWLAGRGYRVSLITWDEGQEDGGVIDGVQVFKVCRKEAGIKGLRFFWPKWISLNAAMKRADADIYYYNCGDLGLGQVVMWSRKHGRKSVYSVASDPDCDVRLPVLEPLRERLLYKYGLRHVDSIVVQTRRQRRMLREGFRRDSVLIPMPCTGFDSNGQVDWQGLHGGTANVLWVGRISREKRFEWLLDIAEKCPEITFDVVGAANRDSEYASALARRAAGIANVNMHGRVPHARIANYYRRCSVLCCTSAYEGFPNTFLEAWSCGIPVVSTFDPDDTIRDKGLGVVAYDIAGIVSGLRGLMQSTDMWMTASEAARRYYSNHHTPEVCLPRFERLFDIVHSGTRSELRREEPEC